MDFAAIILAAGAGRRFGGDKLLARYRDRPLLQWSIDAAKAAPVGEILIVAGANEPSISSLIAGRRGSRSPRVIVAEDWAEGMSASLRRGIASLPDVACGAFIFLADMPEAPRDAFPPLAEAVRRGAPAAAPLYAGRRGHPVVLSRRLFARVAELRGDEGARRLLSRAALIETDSPGAVFDIDRPSDLRKTARSCTV